MKKNFLLVPVLIVVIISCKKTTIETVPPTPPVDTTKPDAPDTAYLKKTEMNYFYDQSGTQILDSSLDVWTYDSKRRPITQILTNFHDLADTSYYSYPPNQYVNHTIVYSAGVLISDLTQTYFFN